MEVQINLVFLRRLLIIVVGTVLGFGLGVIVLQNLLDLPFLTPTMEFFSLSEEKNLPTWISSLNLAGCSVLLGLIALAARQLKRRYVAHWWFLALAFAYISLDEFVEIHESANNWFELGGVLHFFWVLPAAVIVVLIGLSYIGFLAHLTKTTRYRFMLAGALYVGGALVLEFPLGYWADLHGNDGVVYYGIDFMQESMEIMGTTLFLYSLLQYIAGEEGVIRLRLVSGRHPDLNK